MKEDNEFNVPEPEEPINTNLPYSLEKYKIKVELLKWFIGTIGLSIITFIINWGFKDRAQGMEEISQYDRYATELIVLNDNPVNKRMLAQFFSKVTPSDKLKEGWQEYFKEVDAEYKIFLYKDSVAKERLAKLSTKDSLKLTHAEKTEKEKLITKVIENERIMRAPIITPDNNTQISIIKNKYEYPSPTPLV